MNLLNRLAKLWIILALLAAFLLVNLVAVPLFYPKFKTFDTQISYSPAQAQQMLDSYTAADRHQYIVTELTLDLVYPPISALLFSLLILTAFRAGFPNQPVLQKLALLPFLVLLVDYLENICVISMLSLHPSTPTWLMNVSNILTMGKYYLSFTETLFLVGWFGWLLRFFEKKEKEAQSQHS